MTPARTLLDAIAALRELTALAKATPGPDWHRHYDALLTDAADPALTLLFAPPDLSPAQLDVLHDWLRREPDNVVPLRAPGASA